MCQKNMVPSVVFLLGKRYWLRQVAGSNNDRLSKPKSCTILQVIYFPVYLFFKYIQVYRTIPSSLRCPASTLYFTDLSIMASNVVDGFSSKYIFLNEFVCISRILKFCRTLHENASTMSTCYWIFACSYVNLSVLSGMAAEYG